MCRRPFCAAPPAGIAGAVVLPVAGVVGGAVQVGRGLANQSEAIREKKAGKIWNKVCLGLWCASMRWHPTAAAEGPFPA